VEVRVLGTRERTVRRTVTIRKTAASKPAPGLPGLMAVAVQITMAELPVEGPLLAIQSTRSQGGCSRFPWSTSSSPAWSR
jgi:hypothetical protein